MVLRSVHQCCRLVHNHAIQQGEKECNSSAEANLSMQACTHHAIQQGEKECSNSSAEANLSMQRRQNSVCIL